MAIDIAARIAALEERIEAACARSGRKREAVKLMAVTKFHPPEAIEAARLAGIKLFGESRVQEAERKFPALPDRDGTYELHLIGSLQRNKAAKASAFFDCIQSVDRDSLIGELGVLTTKRKNPLMIMLEYHTGEDTKSGFPDQESLFRAADRVLSFPFLRPAGLMTMAPFTGDEAAIRLSFRKLAAARDELEKRFPGNWSCLSMGMTNDFELAIEEGSNLIRIGTAIFGDSMA